MTSFELHLSTWQGPIQQFQCHVTFQCHTVLCSGLFSARSSFNMARSHSVVFLVSPHNVPVSLTNSVYGEMYFNKSTISIISVNFYWKLVYPCCDIQWVFMLLLWENLFSHTVHWYGFSPVCVRKCISSWYLTNKNKNRFLLKQTDIIKSSFSYTVKSW